MMVNVHVDPHPLTKSGGIAIDTEKGGPAQDHRELATIESHNGDIGFGIVPLECALSIRCRDNVGERLLALPTKVCATDQTLHVRASTVFFNWCTAPRARMDTEMTKILGCTHHVARPIVVGHGLDGASGAHETPRRRAGHTFKEAPLRSCRDGSATPTGTQTNEIRSCAGDAFESACRPRLEVS